MGTRNITRVISSGELTMNELLAGKNELQETVIVEEGEKVRVIKTLQDNGWMRIRIEHEDGTVEELYER